MFWNKKKKESSNDSITWNLLEDLSQLNTIIEESKTQPILIYKHSTRCSISGMALSRLERSWKNDGHEIKAYYLDLIRFREVSNAVAHRFEVYHESPQVIVIKNGAAVYDESHMSIRFDSIVRHATLA